MTISSHGGRSKCADACWCKSLCWEIASCQPLNLNIHACHTSSIQPQGKRWEAVLQLGTTIIDLVIAWQWRRIRIWGATNARQNLAISLTLGILHSGRICCSIFFHLAKRILGRHCLQNYLQYTQNHVKSYITSLCQRLGTVPWYTVSKYTIKSPIPTRFLSLSPQKVTQEPRLGPKRARSAFSWLFCASTQPAACRMKVIK